MRRLLLLLVPAFACAHSAPTPAPQPAPQVATAEPIEPAKPKQDAWASADAAPAEGRDCGEDDPADRCLELAQELEKQASYETAGYFYLKAGSKAEAACGSGAWTPEQCIAFAEAAGVAQRPATYEAAKEAFVLCLNTQACERLVVARTAAAAKATTPACKGGNGQACELRWRALSEMCLSGHDVPMCRIMADHADLPVALRAGYAAFACELGDEEACDGLSERLPKKRGTLVTQDHYLLALDGMRHSTVAALIGSPGTEASRVNVLGIPDVTIYRWENRDGSAMQATFQRGRLVSKMQVGLE